MTVLRQLRWAALRIIFYLMAVAGVLSMGLSGYLLAPLYSYYLFGNFKVAKNHRYFFPLNCLFWKIFFRWLHDREYRDMFSLPLFSPPLNGPDCVHVQLAGQWRHSEYDCNNCVKCCLQLECPLLDRQSNLCQSYDTLYWRYFNCGRYPMSQKQLDYYECPKWEIK